MKSKIERLGKVSITVEKEYWNINKAYDRLTIVERQGTRTAYLSRIAVPIGASIDNRNYWITISKYNDIPYEIVQELGDSPEVVISQKVVTIKINELQTLIDNILEVIGKGGSIDERIAAAKSEVKSEIVAGASENTDTLEKVEVALNNRYTKQETYSKEEVNNLITTPNQQYVSVNSYEDLPGTGESDTIYRVAGTTSYSEYAWNGATYIPLDEKNVGIDNEPTAGSENLVKSGGVAKQIGQLKETIGGSVEKEVTTPLTVNLVDEGAIFAVDASSYDPSYTLGSVDTRSSTKTNYKYSNYVDIRDYLNKDSTLIYLNMIRTSAQSNVLLGCCFYDSNYEPILGVQFKGDSETAGAEISTIDIPANAAYIRFSVNKTYESEFTASVQHLATVYSDGMLKDIDDLKTKTDAIENEISIKIIDNSCINYTNGNVETSSEYNSTYYVKIRGFEKFSIPSFTVSVPSTTGLAFYNRNKQYVSGIHYPYKNFGYSFIRYIAPAEACYVRFTVLPNTTPYINIESHAPIAPYFNTYLAFNTPQAKGQFKIFINFNNGVMLGSCGNDKISSNDGVLIYRSTDWGITWAYLGNATQEETLQLREGIYYGDHDGNGNAVVGSGDLGEHYLLKVTNYGESWPSDYNVVANATFINNIVGVNTNGVENVIYCGNNKYRAFCNSMDGFTGHNAVIESNDGGETWHSAASTQQLLASLRSVYKDSRGVLWGAGMHGDIGVWKSTDNGLNWSRKSDFLAFQSIIEYNGYLFCGAINNNNTEAYVYRSADNGETWDKVLTIAKFTPIYHRTFIPYKNTLIAVFCRGEGSTSNEVSWQVTLDNGDTWGEINRTGIYEGGFVELACIIGDTYYINTHSGLQKI